MYCIVIHVRWCSSVLPTFRHCQDEPHDCHGEGIGEDRAVDPEDQGETPPRLAQLCAQLMLPGISWDPGLATNVVAHSRS